LSNEHNVFCKHIPFFVTVTKPKKNIKELASKRSITVQTDQIYSQWTDTAQQQGQKCRLEIE
jgi:hypothetical protein